jgi:hypothetical protein
MEIKIRVITNYNKPMENASIDLTVDSYELWNLLSVLSLSNAVSNFFVDNGSGFTINKQDADAVYSYNNSFRDYYGHVHPSNFEKWIYLH